MKEIFYEIFHFPLLEYFTAINKIFKDDPIVSAFKSNI